MKATQDNIVLVDCDTFTFHKGDDINLSIHNPWYVNLQSAPDLVEGVLSNLIHAV